MRRVAMALTVGLMLGGVFLAEAVGPAPFDIINLTTGLRIGGAATSGRYLRGDGTNFIQSSIAAAGTGTCTNQFPRTLNDNAAPTCATVALTTDTSGNYAAGDAEAGAALTGDTATAFFSAGQLEAARGGTGDDTSASTGVPRIAAGNWTYDAGVSHLAASSSADLIAVLSDETGSGLAVFGTSPVIDTADINTPDIDDGTIDGAAIGGATPDTGAFTTASASTSLTVGSGAAITKHLSATATLNFPSTAGETCDELTITVSGAADGDTVVIGVPSASANSANSMFYGRASAGTAHILHCCTASAVGSCDPGSGTFRADVWQH